MPTQRQSFVAAIALVAGLLVACGSDKPASSGSRSTSPAAAPTSAASAGSPTTAGPPATQPAPAGKVDCNGLGTTLAGININWQVVLGLPNSATTEWVNIPLGTMPQFGDELASAKQALGNDANAAASLDYMSKANDIAQRGIGGDASAQTDLASYLGTDITANVSKQVAIATAFANVGC
jgi:hypothetical protein